jgi:hypothetical protein
VRRTRRTGHAHDHRLSGTVGHTAKERIAAIVDDKRCDYPRPRACPPLPTVLARLSTLLSRGLFTDFNLVTLAYWLLIALTAAGVDPKRAASRLLRKASPKNETAREAIRMLSAWRGRAKRAEAVDAVRQCAESSKVNSSGPTCGRPIEAGKAASLCGGCRIRSYCSARCQHADWRAGHSAECVDASALYAAALRHSDVQNAINQRAAELKAVLAGDSLAPSAVAVSFASAAADAGAIDRCIAPFVAPLPEHMIDADAAGCGVD